MATISLSDNAPQEPGKIHFTFGAESFELGSGDSYESSAPEVLASAQSHPWLEVKADEVDGGDPEAAAKAVAESSDPHVNRYADHLSGFAPKEVVEAAAANEAKIREEFGDTADQVPAEPAETLEAPAETVEAPAEETSPAQASPTSEVTA
jgi:hypothetical protein